ncbi:MAG: hypothetical protein ACXWYG_09975 [Aeromicrobium sp.]
MWGEVVAGLKQLGNILNEIVGRITSLLDFLGSLIGLRWRQRMRLRVVILRDENGVPLLGEGTGDGVSPEDEAWAAVELVREIYRRECNVSVVGVGDGPIVMVAPSAAPTAALDVACNLGAWRDDLGEAGSYFRSLAAGMFAGLPVGYGAPVTAFVVRSMGNAYGCSLGPLTNYVTVSAAAMRNAAPRALAHELGHACFLLHRKARNNLMIPPGGEHLTRWQVAVVRSSPHVSFW